MYPHIEQAAEVCLEEAEQFLIEGFELAPWYPGRLQAALPGVSIRACFLGHPSFHPDDLAAYHGPKPQHETVASDAELAEAAAWIRYRSLELAEQCRIAGVPYIDIGQHSFESTMQMAWLHLMTPISFSR
jgi:hypothetical protein